MFGRRGRREKKAEFVGKKKPFFPGKVGFIKQVIPGDL
jgi:hypothetical protein